MKVVILGAGQGKRLLPLTSDIPKALLDIGGKSLIERQIDAFATCGVREYLVVTGYAAGLMESALASIAQARGVSVKTIFNPFYAVADNLASCWMARGEMTGDFVQLNGDTLFRADLAARMLAAPLAPVTVAINHKERYDADDMKVMSDAGRLTEIGKTLPPETVDAEAIGIYSFRDTGPKAYVDVLEASMREPQGLKQWFPSAVGRLAKTVEVRTLAVDGFEWCEVDFPVDLQHARQLVAYW
ncbi:MAG: phosphocholine cytidylyltransferase family protein [Rhizobiales bacterium]|nr:phosphocholine cytidylyltransferase family protein [Hyphomicrobiales bacterium]